MLLVGSVFDRCLVACTYAAAETPAIPACHQDANGAAALETPATDGVFARACDHDRSNQGTLAELTTAGRPQELTRAVVAEIPGVTLSRTEAVSAHGVVINGPPLLVLDTGSDRRQLRL